MGTIANHDFTDRFLKCGNYHKSRFHRSVSKMWELPQITISQIDF
ncbi:hypothetical protein G436_3323 [Leptospira interrogans serovar Hardjo str. Norma]|uniref:Uncharacterized protein n=1 Tax=Leptospira interrogans serovar Hardjo str. Norma TaxID=1279460 RepID=A0A0M4NAK8_LEPIR|nr:hypothetical protein G436_3323 [Leptospira interrogans serovar Hardjo str. Norma]